MKRGFNFLILGVLVLICLYSVNAQTVSLSDILKNIEPSLIILGVIWIVSFSLIYFSLSRLILKDNPAISSIIALALSLLITWGYNQTNWNVSVLFPNIGISLDFLSGLFPIILIGTVVLLFFLLKYNAFFIIGGVCVVGALLGWVYEKTILFVIGAIFLAAGIGFAIKANKKRNEKTLLDKLMGTKKK